MALAVSSPFSLTSVSTLLFCLNLHNLVWIAAENNIYQYGNDRIGIVYDVANAVFIKEDLAEGLRRVRDRLRLVHLSDTGLSVYRHDPVGLGVVPFSDIPPALREVGYAELPMLEIISQAADTEIRESADKLLAMGWRDNDA